MSSSIYRIIAYGARPQAQIRSSHTIPSPSGMPRLRVPPARWGETRGPDRGEAPSPCAGRRYRLPRAPRPGESPALRAGSGCYGCSFPAPIVPALHPAALNSGNPCAAILFFQLNARGGGPRSLSFRIADTIRLKAPGSRAIGSSRPEPPRERAKCFSTRTRRMLPQGSAPSTGSSE